MSDFFEINHAELTANDIGEIISQQKKLRLSAEVHNSIIQSREFLESRLNDSSSPLYGVNTGFGALYHIPVKIEDLESLQEKMLLSHACGMGDYVPREIVRIMLLLKIICLSKGKSGVTPELINRLIDFYNHGITPVVYQQGSLGASGDLVPLAHLSLPLIGHGLVWEGDELKDASEVLKKKNWNTLKLQSKEGLALLNGTQFMGAYMIHLVLKSESLIKKAELIAAISLDAFDCKTEPFHPAIQKIRNHKGQIETAEKILLYLEGSEIQNHEKKNLQDPYSFRCIPQVLGATREVVNHVGGILHQEINAVTDNPLIFPEEQLILSGGNFHGQALALALDYLCIAMHEIGNISERRIYQMISGKRDLPSFLIANPGLNSGLMIVQYVAASIVSQNKQLCTPASADSIESSAGQEDHVSMGANAATKAWQVVENIEKILAIELFTATQALEFRKPLKTSPFLEEIILDYRKMIPPVTEDRILHLDIIASVNFLKNHPALKYAID